MFPAFMHAIFCPYHLFRMQCVLGILMPVSCPQFLNPAEGYVHGLGHLGVCNLSLLLLASVHCTFFKSSFIAFGLSGFTYLCVVRTSFH